jgi:hypothetical protein
MQVKEIRDLFKKLDMGTDTNIVKLLMFQRASITQANEKILNDIVTKAQSDADILNTISMISNAIPKDQLKKEKRLTKILAAFAIIIANDSDQEQEDQEQEEQEQEEQEQEDQVSTIANELKVTVNQAIEQVTKTVDMIDDKHPIYDADTESEEQEQEQVQDQEDQDQEDQVQDQDQVQEVQDQEQVQEVQDQDQDQEDQEEQDQEEQDQEEQEEQELEIPIMQTTFGINTIVYRKINKLIESKYSDDFDKTLNSAKLVMIDTDSCSKSIYPVIIHLTNAHTYMNILHHIVDTINKIEQYESDQLVPCVSGSTYRIINLTNSGRYMYIKISAYKVPPAKRVKPIKT